MVVGTISGNSLTVEAKITSTPKNGGKPKETEVTSVGKIDKDLMPIFLSKEGGLINLKGGAPGMGGPHRVIHYNLQEVGLEPKEISDREVVDNLPVVRMKKRK
jgi:hypothetical protein